MTMNTKSLAGLAISAGLVAATIWAEKTHWFDGDNFFLLSMLGGLHFFATALVLWLFPPGKILRIVAVLFLIVGQWRWIEFIAMVTIWKLNGFAP